MYNEEEAARPYARAWVQAAQALGILEDVRADAAALEAQWQGSEVFREWARTFHSMPRAKHREVVDALWGETVSRPTRVLLEALSENGLMAALPHVLQVFRRLADMAEGRRAVLLEFAANPSPKTVALLTARAREAYGPKTEITIRVAPELGAGVVIRAGDLQIDGSLTGRLRRLSRAFHQPEQPGNSLF